MASAVAVSSTLKEVGAAADEEGACAVVDGVGV
jgi:hypothetical protein